ncbi:MAG: DNA polymerase II large subunit [Candidatus Thorarchaeota archaeon]|nr:MAG: DNA polymerase II large subunit [Candidatus Thorarchaeota archaeon]
MTENDSDLPLPAHSLSYKLYFDSLSEAVTEIYKVAEAARAIGYDPQKRVEIPPAHDVAARVEATLEGPKGVAKRIRELQETHSREEVAFIVAKEVALGELGGITDSEKAADKAVRVALSILTESITAAPLEGISKVRIRGSGSEQYLALYLAGPIRAAGGTEAAVTVLVADYVRQVLQLPAYRATEDEVERALEEIELYARNANLQYTLKPEHIRFAASKLPIMLTGDPTERYEVSGSRDLERIESNRVRGGSVLVLNDGVVGRAAKLSKIVNRVNIPGWEWLDELASKVSKAKTTKDDDSAKKLAPKPDYLADVIGGRPVFSHPSRVGGFRLRYGRSRNTGLAGVGTHPATMFLVEEFLAPGTHIRTERPGKGSIVAPVDTIEGPIVLLQDGTVKQVFTSDEARTLQNKVVKILFLGDILIALGEFLENNHPLVPSGYCEEWWSHDLEHICSKFDPSTLERKLSDIDLSTEQVNMFIQEPLTSIPAPHQALDIAITLGLPLHPRYLYRWLAISPEQTLDLRNWLLQNQEIRRTSEGKRIVVPFQSEYKEILELLGMPHRMDKKKQEILLSDYPETILAQLGKSNQSPIGDTSLEIINSVSTVEVRDKLGFAIGARMGRPEKALARKMRPPVQALFPVGRTSSSERRIEKVAESTRAISTLDMFDGALSHSPVKSGVTVELVARICPKCKKDTFESLCPDCKVHTDLQRWCSHEECGLPVSESTGFCPRRHDVNLLRDTRDYQLNLSALLDRVKREIGEPQTYGIRGVLGLTSDLKIPEYIGKGILRAKYDVYCYRDGTARFDATDAPLTHFIPREIGVPVEKLNEIGYEMDIKGNPLVSEDQIVELMVQDIIVPENCADYLIRVGTFVDDCLEKIYGLDRFYNFSTQTDIVGQLVIGLAPHTSAGIIGRIIGFTNASLCYAHPYWHAAKRRNCDGDEDAVILVLDALLNFSKSYLPAGRGGFMDAPLVLSVILNPSEVDDEAHNIEVCSRYPAEFYNLVSEAKHPKVVEGLVDIIGSRLNSPIQYEGFMYTHGTSSFDVGPKNTRYKILGSMVEKLEAQLRLAKLIHAVDERDVASRVLSNHFLRDIRGNLRAYSTQKIQCLKCRRVYRRVPLSGFCKCGATLSLTVRKKNISKYLEVAKRMIEEHGLSDYLRQRIRLVNISLESLFFSEQTSLTDFF